MVRWMLSPEYADVHPARNTLVLVLRFAKVSLRGFSFINRRGVLVFESAPLDRDGCRFRQAYRKEQAYA